MTTKPLKILITDPHFKGGGQVRYVANLARELTRLGHEVIVGCKPGSVLAERAREAGCRVLDGFHFRGGMRPPAWRDDLRAARKFIASENPSLLHVNGSQDHWVCALANRLMGRPICVVRTRHNTYPVSDNLANRALNLEWTDYQIVVCDLVRRKLASQRSFDGNRMCSIHNGVDAEAFCPDPGARTSARAEFGYSGEHIVCGIAARLTEAKGHRYLFEAAAQLRQDFPQLRLLVLGQGELDNSLRRLTIELGIKQITHFAGFRDDMARCVQAFDIGVQPSIDCDTSSFSLKEQMAAEKAVIASDYGGLTEIVSDGVEGIVVPAGTVEPLTNALRELIRNPQRRAAMGQAGRARVLRDFTVQLFAKRTVEAYQRAIEIHRERTAHR